MFAKISLISFIYDLIQTFCFPNKKAKEIYERYFIEYVCCYHILTDTSSTSIFFVFNCDSKSSIEDEKCRNCLFEIICVNKIRSRFDTSHSLWENFLARDESLRNKMGYYVVEHIDHPYLVTIAVNPKEYSDQFKSDTTNKKHKGLKTGLKGMDLKNYGKRINLVKDIEMFGQLPSEKFNQYSFKK